MSFDGNSCQVSVIHKPLSQNETDLCRCLVHLLLLKTQKTWSGYSRLYPMMFRKSPRMENPQPLWYTCSRVQFLFTVKQVFLKFKQIFLYCSLCPLPLVLLHPHQYLNTLMKSSWAFSYLGWTIPGLSASLVMEDAPVP